jgi:dephospho-CoA kinase
MPFVVGLTGGIGSGKSAAAEEFARLGATVIDADAIAHELTASGGAAIPAIRKLFGDAYVDPAGAMDRGKVRTLAFTDVEAKRRLEALLHPMIREESLRRIAAATGPYVVYVVPLLIESGNYRSHVQRVLVVDCPEEEQIARVRQRSGLAEDQIRKIIAAQATREARLAVADDVIDNSATLDSMRQAVRRLHKRYVSLAAGSPRGDRPGGA